MSTDGDGLGVHLARKRSLILAAGGDPANRPPPVRSRLRATAEAHDATGVRRVRVRDFGLLSDSGPGLGGHDLGPSSPELFLSSLASCLCHIFLTQAAVRDVELDVLATMAEASLVNGSGAYAVPDMPGYPHDVSYVADIMAPGPDDELLELWAMVRRHCPIYLLVSRAVPVTGTLRRIAPDKPPRVLGHQVSDAHSRPPSGDRDGGGQRRAAGQAEAVACE